MIIKPRHNPITGIFTVPSDKSISHRTVLTGSLAKGRSRVRGFLRSADCLSTIACMRALGVDIVEEKDGDIIISGAGIRGLKEPSDVLDAGNSGTTIRLLSGILASYSFFSVITGDDSLRSRPMKRIIEPLSLMGADIRGRKNDSYPPLAISGGNLHPIRYRLPVASAQVKSAILLAGLAVDGETVIEEPLKSRDHTERMLKAAGGDIRREGDNIILHGGKEISPFDTNVPGDISSAAFLIAAALLIPGSKIRICNVGVNPVRMGFPEVVRRMGAKINIDNERENEIGEPVADIDVEYSPLNSVEIEREEIPALIDEIPLISILGASAKGRTTVKGAEELRVKETDRIAAVAENIRRMGGGIEIREDGFVIEGEQKLHGGAVDSMKDHRIAMTFAVAGLAAKGETEITDDKVVNVSYPGFWDLSFFG